jgi:hypothetical protein
LRKKAPAHGPEREKAQAAKQQRLLSKSAVEEMHEASFVVAHSYVDVVA